MGIHGDGTIVRPLVSPTLGAEKQKTVENNLVDHHFQCRGMSWHGYPFGLRVILK